jgi:hypothetical protein
VGASVGAFARWRNSHGRLQSARVSRSGPALRTCEGHGQNPHRRDSAAGPSPGVKKSPGPPPPPHIELSALFRRRQIWLPTLWGVLLLCIVGAIATLVSARMVGGYLAQTDPAAGSDGRGARTLVVEGWLEAPELDDAIAVARRGGYERIVTSGGPIDSWQEGVVWPNYAERAAGYLRRHGPAGIAVVAVAAPATGRDRTYLSALVVREWLRREQPGLAALDLLSAGVHARRSRLAYRMAFGPEVEVGVLAAPPRGYDIDRWWLTSQGAKTVLGELISLAWTKCCFWPAAGSHEERGALAKPAP